jgi:hypothetical protein
MNTPEPIMVPETMSVESRRLNERLNSVFSSRVACTAFGDLEEQYANKHPNG